MDCCNNNKKKDGKGVGRGILYGLIPHLGCLGFIAFSILGVTVGVTVFRSILITPFLIHALIGLSLVFATFSLVLYLKKNNKLSFSGLLDEKSYATTLYGTTLIVNLLFFLVIFPAVAEFDSEFDLSKLSASTSRETLQVDIPCEGHSFLINNELNDLEGVEGVEFSGPNYFEVFYDNENVDIEKITSLDIFEKYEAWIKNN